MQTITRPRVAVAAGALLAVAALVATVVFGHSATPRAAAHGTVTAHRTPVPRGTEPAESGVGGSTDLGVVRGAQVLHYAAGHPDEVLDVLRPRQPIAPGRSPWVLVIHGGSWLQGGPVDMLQIADDLAAHGYVVFDVAYPLVNHRTDYAQQFAGLTAAWHWIRAHAHGLRVDPDRGAACGFSAGGQLAAMLGSRVPGVRAVVSMSGVLEPELIARIVTHEGEAAAPTVADTNLFHHMENLVVRTRWRPWDPSALRRWNAFSPAGYVTAATPPTLIAQGLADGVVPPRTATLYADTLAAHHVANEVALLPGVGHDEVADAAGIEARALAWLARYDGRQAP